MREFRDKIESGAFNQTNWNAVKEASMLHEESQLHVPDAVLVHDEKIEFYIINLNNAKFSLFRMPIFEVR